MASIFTGQTPSLETAEFGTPLEWNGQNWCGMARFATASDASCIPQSLNTLAEMLKANRFWTIGVASNALTFDPAGYSQGFDDWREVRTTTPLHLAASKIARERGAAVVNEVAIRAVEARPSDRFFLYVHYMDVHDYGMQFLSYAQAVRNVDDAIGDLLDQLESRGLLRDAVVVVTSDHGERLGEPHALEGMGTHLGNPSFEQVLRVPVIVWPRLRFDLPSVVRGQDIRFLIERMVNAHSESADHADEVLLTERRYLTYRRYPYKLMWRRQDNQLFLFNLEEDPGELHDIAQARPELATQQRERAVTLVQTVIAAHPLPAVLTDSDRERLRALGYAP